MNRRERILLVVVISGVLLFAGLFLGKNIFIKPLRALDSQTLALRDKLRQIHDERRAYFAAEDFLRGVAARTFGRDPDTASAQAGKMLTGEIVRLGLKESQFSRLPVGPRKFRGAQEVGWSVQGEGPLEKMLDLLFVLEQTPQLHRLENLVISAAGRPGWVRARFRYLTLVLEDAPPAGAVELKPGFALDSPQRRQYDAIVQRDLLRPYVPKPRSEQPSPMASAPSQGSAGDQLKVVSLSEWAGKPEVHVSNLSSGQVSIYRPGDTLEGARIVKIDYRTLPSAVRPGFVSYSRVILQIDSDYYAVEPGQTVSSKQQLRPEQLPVDLVGAN